MSKDDDFNPSKTIEEVAANLEQPAKFAKIFCNAAESQKSIDTILKNSIREIIKCDIETRKELKDILREVDKEDWKLFLKKIGGIGWAVILLILGGVIQGLSRKFLG